ncbi:MAG: hypothetical protein ABFR97_10970 [Thermodesulfobacteriota bacterium]
MAMVNIDSLARQVKTLLKKMVPGQGLEILTYKRNRGLAIIKAENELLWVREHGYHAEEWQIAPAALSRLLKSICKREFPRSRKVRLYRLASRDEMDPGRQKI